VRIQRLAVLAVSAAIAALVACADPDVDYSGAVAQWPEYGGDKGGTRYSPLTQITPQNIDSLELAWEYRHGDISDGSDGTTRTSFNATPLVVDGKMFFCTGMNRVIALDPESGAELWSFDPEMKLTKLKGPYPRTCRGVAFWRDPLAAAGTTCATRIFSGTLDSELIAIDAESGKACAAFGSGGRVSLRDGIDAPAWEYYPTSPPVAVRDVVVVGALVADNLRVDAPGGVVRGFDARSGALRWAWDPVPPGWTPPANGPKYQTGTPNVWSILSGDDERGLVFVPTGNASPDAYGGARNGLDHYASSTVALDVETGHVAWHYQTVHHDVWDYDVASQPVLFQLAGVGGGAPAVAQATKMGHLFLLNRDTGEPLYPVEERAVPQGAVAGESLSPTQPFPTHPAPLHAAQLTPEDAWGFTPIDRADCAERIAGARSEGIFTPPSVEGTLQFPGAGGGANWGSVSIDPERGVLFVNQMHAAQLVWLIERDDFAGMDPDAVTYPDELYPQTGTPYALRKAPLLSNFGAPCNPPPWGTLTAVDLASGEVRWVSTLGSTRDQAPFPLWFDFGSPNLGGSIATASGLVFIGATTDKFLRAFDAETGEIVWKQRLPYTANATPLTYRLREDGKQYIVVVAGGHGWSEPGDTVMAFALP
jgi:quinoprotein glucose dehydrogenase